MKRALARFLNDEAGVTAIEYGLVAALIAVASISSVSNTGASLGKLYAYVQSNVSLALK